MQQLAHNPAFPNLLNVRDLGSYANRAGRPLRQRSLLRADDLHRLTPGGAQALVDYGIRTVIDLRWPADTESHPNPFHERPGLVNHLHISLLGSSVEAWVATRPPGPKETFNCRVLEYARSETCSVLRAIAAAPAGAVLFHCVSGKDRTGVVAALLLALADVDPQVIIDDYGLSTEKLREPYLAAFPDEQEATLERIRCPPAQIENMLAHLDQHYGGVTGYLHEIGLTDQEVTQLTQRLF
ncbi:MAG: tyrosine-protein phosphatase [Caldilineaceae bacterium]|nr:tyrosine-protein phosphatase [Caldilineaceae bacterium]